MATFRDVIIRALTDSPLLVMQSVNMNLIEVSKASKRKPGYLKVAVSDETAEAYLAFKQKKVGFVLHFDGDLLQRIADELDKEST